MVSTSQGDSGDLIRRAVAAFNSGNHGQAVDLCELGLKQHPDDPALCHLLAAVLFAKADLPEARTRIEASLAARPDSVPALILACRIARAQGRPEAALQHLDRAARQSSQAEILLERARTLDLAGDASAAGVCWTLVLQREPKSREAMARLGHLAWERGESLEAEAFLEGAVAGDGHPAAWFDLGLVRQRHAAGRQRRRSLSTGAGDEPGRAGGCRQSGRRLTGSRRPRWGHGGVFDGLSFEPIHLRRHRYGAYIGAERPSMA